ncbi:MAG: phosphoglycerate transporter [Protaetiibacter sp.]
MDQDALRELIVARSAKLRRPIVVGVSGFGGSGKSTLTRPLVDAIPGAVRMRGDDFLDPVRSHRRSLDWDGVERTRLVDEVLVPFRTRQASTFRRYDWARGALAAPEPVPAGRVMIVDVIGLFHPEATPALDLTVWCDVDLETATERGMRRDAAAGRDHARLWREVWVPNERDFAAAFAPRESAEVLFSPEPS